MLTQDQIDYISGKTARVHAVNPMVIHGEIKAPALSLTTNPVVQWHKPTDAGRRNV